MALMLASMFAYDSGTRLGGPVVPLVWSTNAVPAGYASGARLAVSPGATSPAGPPPMTPPSCTSKTTVPPSAAVSRTPARATSSAMATRMAGLASASSARIASAGATADTGYRHRRSARSPSAAPRSSGWFRQITAMAWPSGTSRVRVRVRMMAAIARISSHEYHRPAYSMCGSWPSRPSISFRREVQVISAGTGSAVVTGVPFLPQDRPPQTPHLCRPLEHVSGPDRQPRVGRGPVGRRDGPGQLGVGGRSLRDLDGGAQQLIPRDYRPGQPGPHGVLGGDDLPEQGQGRCRRRCLPDQQGQVAAAWVHPGPAESLEHHVVGGDHDVGRQREVHSRAHQVPLRGGHGRHRRGGQEAEHFVNGASFLERGGSGWIGSGPPEQAEVAAGAVIWTFGCDDQGADRRVVASRQQARRKKTGHLAVQGIALRTSADGEDGNGAIASELNILRMRPGSRIAGQLPVRRYAFHAFRVY